MSRIYVEFAGLKQIGDNCKTVSSSVSSIRSEFRQTVRQLDWDIRYQADINQTAERLSEKIDSYSQTLQAYQNYLNEAYDRYRQLDENIFGRSSSEKSVWEKFLDRFKDQFGWDDLLKGAGYPGTIYNLINDLKKGKNWPELAKVGLNAGVFLVSAADTYRKYKKIGRAVGAKTAMTWWGKKILGLKPLGRASTARSPFLRFKNNLFNKTSPFNLKGAYVDLINDFKGANGVGKAAASWAGTILDGVINWFDNRQEQAESGGTMSDGRVIAETLTETAVDTILITGGTALAGAAVAAVTPVAVPGVLIAAGTGLILTGVNAGVEAVSGKSAVEWISDAALDTGEYLIGKAQETGRAVGKWVQDIWPFK